MKPASPRCLPGRRRVGAIGLLLALGLAVGTPWARAHAEPEEEIEELTERLRLHRDSVDLLIQRATEYKVLGKHAEAAKDLEAALAVQSESITARRELSQTYFTLGKTNEALECVNRALKSPADAEERAGLLMVRAGILRARRETAKALRDANDALLAYPLNAEWYFVRAQLQEHLRLPRERIQGLEDGMRVTGSGLLRAEWIDALIAAGEGRRAASAIEQELHESRWRGSWLIRRARIRQAEGQATAAKEDLLEALDELNIRLGALVPDALLLNDRGMVHELLGRPEDALRDYRSARDKGLRDEAIEERIRRLAKDEAGK